MTWLFLAIVLDFGFIQFFKYAQRRGFDASVVVSTNYLTLSAAIGLYLLMTDSWAMPAGAAVTGMVTGGVFISSMLLMNHALRLAPVGAVLTAFRLSIAVPVAIGVYLWGEPMSVGKLGGLFLALLALALMTPGTGAVARRTDVKLFGLLAAICAWQGVSHTCLRSVHYQGYDPVFLQILMVIGLAAGALGGLVVVVRKRRPTRPAITLGIFIGLYNAVALAVIMTALSQLPGTVFYPIMGCSVVLLDNLFAHFYWKERLARPAVAGVGIAVAALVLVI